MHKSRTSQSLPVLFGEDWNPNQQQILCGALYFPVGEVHYVCSKFWLWSHTNRTPVKIRYEGSTDETKETCSKISTNNTVSYVHVLCIRLNTIELRWANTLVINHLPVATIFMKSWLNQFSVKHNVLDSDLIQPSLQPLFLLARVASYKEIQL